MQKLLILLGLASLSLLSFNFRSYLGIISVKNLEWLYQDLQFHLIGQTLNLIDMLDQYELGMKKGKCLVCNKLEDEFCV